jgi:hypothetical protein
MAPHPNFGSTEHLIVLVERAVSDDRCAVFKSIRQRVESGINHCESMVIKEEYELNGIADALNGAILDVADNGGGVFR